ncbi:diguanylate cyclase [Clostridium bovifaecis]|uniref:Diguanylate cyclase n=1 Tax=Clostridium bovifaecis TaxID=2184719 RepID=A0A6I6EMB0_9CLOT|nr:diguanylate cyclase [Clostridium bovifaecis]
MEADIREIQNSIVGESDKKKKSDLLNWLSFKISDIDSSRALEVSREALRLSQEIDYKHGIGNSFLQIGHVYSELSKYDEGRNYLLDSLEIFKETGDKESQIKALTLIGANNFEDKRYEAALRYYMEGLEIARNIKHKSMQGDILNNIGQTYMDLNNKEIALEYYLKSLEALDREEDKSPKIDVLINLGRLYMSLKNYNKALDYLEEALYIGEKAPVSEKLHIVYLVMTEYFESQGEFKKALYYYKKYHFSEKEAQTEDLQNKINIISMEFKIEKAQKEAEIYRLKNVELKEKSKELKEINKRLIGEIEERKKAQDESEFFSIHDPLTAMYNRTYFERESRILSAVGFKSLGVIFCDIDSLKLVNDTFGHSVGDELIVLISQILKTCVKDEDKIIRMGGDEFIILLPSISQEKIEEICESINKVISDTHLKNINLPVSASIGAAIGDGVDVCIEELVRQADDNMYKQKIFKREVANEQIIESIINNFKNKDYTLYIHGMRVAEMATTLGKVLGFNDSRIQDLSMASIYHDIGKVRKKDSACECRRHSELGYRIAKTSSYLKNCADWILQHHEYWNGTGYPFNLKGEEIAIEAQIIGISDFYDRVINNIGLAKEDAIEEIKRQSGIRFNPSLVSNFVCVVKAGEIKESF